SSAPNVECGEPEWGSEGGTGVSDFGREAVTRANALGMMVDVSHASDYCMRDALGVARAPVLASHSPARALVDHKRNIPDDILRAIGERGGVVQAVAYKEFVKHVPARAAAERALQAEVAKLAGDAEYDDSKHDSLPAMAEGMARIQQEHPLATVQEYVDHI